MKRKLYSADGPRLIKTSISIPDVLMKFAEQRCTEEGFNSFSSYLAHLVRLDKERRDHAYEFPPPKPKPSGPNLKLNDGTNTEQRKKN